jgi:tetratricopeptide (TPR) repeat protein
VTFKKNLRKQIDRGLTNRKNLIHEVLERGYEGYHEESLELLDKAIYLFDTNLDTTNTKVELWHLKAIALQQLERNEEALKAIEKAKEFLKFSLKQDLKNIILPRDTENYNMDSLNGTHSDILQDLERYEEALDIVIPKADSVIENWKNIITRKNNDNETADGEFVKVNEGDEYYADAGIIHRQAVLFSRLGKNTEALDNFDTILESDPNDVNALFEKSDILENIEKHDEALKTCEQGLKIVPDDGDLLGLKGSILFSLKKYEESLSFFEKSIESDSTDNISWYNKACVLSILNKIEESLDALTVAIGLDSENIIEMKDDNDLDNIKNTERFKRLANQEI